MLKTEKSYFILILMHVIIGVLMYYFGFFPKMYGFGIILGGAFFVINSQNKNNEVLYAAAYIVGSEVVLRMTSGNPIYEFSKYGVMIFMVIGIYFSGISKNAVPYWIFLLLLIPGVIISTLVLNYGSSMRKEISFNISGPVCLGICSLYTYTRRVTLHQLNNILLVIGLPIITCVVYLTLYTPSIRDIVTGTNSNADLTGGFGPNQVSTIFGLGMFIFIARLIYNSSTKFLLVINLVIILNISFRGLISFSRGGMITGIVMILMLILITYLQINSVGKAKLRYLMIFVILAMVATWTYSSSQTGGLIDKRYANKDVSGKVKEKQLAGRAELADDEFATFLANPIFGVGVGKNMELRKQKTGEVVVSHNEITRMFAEHGSIGILALLIIFITPLVLYVDNKYNIYLLCFLAFWLLTINHAAMRLAAPAFIYSLSLLKVVFYDEKSALHRE